MHKLLSSYSRPSLVEVLDVNLTNEIKYLGRGETFDVHEIYSHFCRNEVCGNINKRLRFNLNLYCELPENECNWSAMQRTQTYELIKLIRKMESEITGRLKKTLPENEKECLWNLFYHWKSNIQLEYSKNFVLVLNFSHLWSPLTVSMNQVNVQKLLSYGSSSLSRYLARIGSLISSVHRGRQTPVQALPSQKYFWGLASMFIFPIR